MSWFDLAIIVAFALAVFLAARYLIDPNVDGRTVWNNGSYIRKQDGRIVVFTLQDPNYSPRKTNPRGFCMLK